MPRKQKKYHYIYKTTCTITGKFYIGMHSTDNLEDGYLGSGKILGYSRRKYGDGNHIKEIVEYCSSRDELKRREKEIVNEELLAQPLNINLKYGGDGGWDHIPANMRRENQMAASLAMSEKLKTDIDFKEAYSKKMSKSAKNVFAEGRGHKINTEIWRGKKQTKEHIEKRKATYAKRKFQQGENNSQFGIKRIGINKDGIIKKILPESLEQFLSNGWKRGFK